MKHQQRVRRSKITTQVEAEGNSDISTGDKQAQENGKEYIYLRNEETSNISTETCAHPEQEESMRCTPPADCQINVSIPSRDAKVCVSERHFIFKNIFVFW